PRNPFVDDEAAESGSGTDDSDWEKEGDAERGVEEEAHGRTAPTTPSQQSNQPTLPALTPEMIHQFHQFQLFLASAPVTPTPPAAGTSDTTRQEASPPGTVDRADGNFHNQENAGRDN
ncbi:hypothetical protein HK097_006587, partial [Rhizophlyctis rosea]